VLDAAFPSDFSVEGRFVAQASNGRRYWYLDTAKEGGGKHRRYAGPVNDPEITRRVEAFKDLKAEFRARRKLVSTLESPISSMAATPHARSTAPA
jgi:hypothetical protein